MALEIRRTLLPHDLSYCLDNASQCCGITAAAEIAIRLYGEASRLDQIWNSGKDVDCGRKWRLSLLDRELAVERYGAEIIAQLPGPRRMALMERGILSLVHDVITKTEWLSDCYYEDMTKGGALRDWLPVPRVRRDMLPTPKVARRLRSRAAIKRYILDEGDELPKQRKLFETLAAIPPGGPATDEDRDAIFRDLGDQMESHARAARQAVETANWMAEMEAMSPAAQVDQVLVRLKPDARRRIRDKIRLELKDRKQRRRAVKRASMLAAAVLGASTVSAFARGEQVMLPGPEVSISAKLTGPISESGHGALSVGVHQLDGTRLAGVCVYQEAPALDQLVSLAMHVQSGNVEDILTIGNLYSIEPAADAHPLIVAHRGARLDLHAGEWEVPPAERPERLGRIRRQDIHDNQQAYNAGKQAYLEEMGPVYEEIIATIVFGRAAPLWRRLRASIKFDEAA
ncbi:hypothetical protein MPL3356_60521 [Mesorhizobium plurifarium]|uniref:Uncharacterized protein n=1 Tax=Mesorhizobium plurifarium TaxID=69974 RepID=A0A090EFK9_MESPL|nr:hypothetical protein MPL3356_60521 [Mesorhizobium plurifarium]